MKELFCKVLAPAVLALLVAAPAAAADAGFFRLENAVVVGNVEVPAGDYMFQASERGLVLVFDENRTKVVAAVLTQRQPLPLEQLETSGTLTHDWAVRTLSLGDWRYSFVPGEKPARVAARPTVTAVAARLR